MVAVPAVFGAVAIVYLSIVIGSRCFFQDLFGQIDGIIEVIVVHIPTVDVQFTGQFRAEACPVPLKNVGQVIVLLPEGRYLGVDLAGVLVPDSLGVAVVSDRAIYGFPDIPLLPRSGSCRPGPVRAYS